MTQSGMRGSFLKLTQCCSRRRGISFDPERHPGQDHGQDAGDVRLDGEVAHSPAQFEVDRHDDVVACRKDGQCEDRFFGVKNVTWGLNS